MYYIAIQCDTMRYDAITCIEIVHLACSIIIDWLWKAMRFMALRTHMLASTGSYATRA